MQNHFVDVSSAFIFWSNGLSVGHNTDDGITNGSNHEHEGVTNDVE